MLCDKKTLIIIVCVIVIAVVVYYKYYNGKSTSSSGHESFVTTGGMQNLGAVMPDGISGDYELISDGNGNMSNYPSIDGTLKATDFAELVDSGTQAVQAQEFADLQRPLSRLQDLSDSYFPTIASKALPFSQAAAKPLVFHHAVNLPRVNLKGKLYEMNLAESIRGSISINYDPNVSLIATSSYRAEDSFNPGLFTGAYNSLYYKLTGGYKNLPMYVQGAGASTSGVGGMGVEAIYDGQ